MTVRSYITATLLALLVLAYTILGLVLTAGVALRYDLVSTVFVGVILLGSAAAFWGAWWSICKAQVVLDEWAADLKRRGIR